MRSRRIFYLQVAFFLFAFFIGILILMKLIGDLKDSSADLSGQISRRSSAILEKFKLSNFRKPASGEPQLFESRERENGDFYISSIGCYFGSKAQWQVPKDAAIPSFSEPMKGFSDVVILSSSKRMFLSRIDDGRTLAIVYETPRYGSQWRQTITISTFLVLFVIAGMILFSFTVRRLAPDDAENAPAKRDIGPMDAVVMMKKTVSELKEKNRELEAKLGAEKTKAKSAASVLESLTSGLDAGFLRFDQAGRLQGLNQNANRLLGLSELMTIGDSHDKIFRGRPGLKALVDETIGQRAILTAEAVEGLQGKLLLVLTIPLLDDLNHFRGVLLIIHDRSRYYAMENAIREKEALARLGEVAAGVAHEIRNGLNVLSGELRLLKQETSDGYATRTGRIENEIGQMERVVRDLLYFSKPLALERETIRLKSFAEEILRSAEAQYTGTVFSSEIEDADFSGDQDSLFRALFNVVSNAAEAAGKGGEVFLKAFATEDHAVILVEDSGEGVSGEAIADLFSLFASHKKGGTGLGLPISRKIAREHGGELSLVKCAKLNGACFEFRVPR